MKPQRVIVIVLLALAAACGPSTRETALRTTLITLDAAGSGFAAWDLEHQRQLVKSAATPDNARNLIASYRADREPVLASFELAYKALAHAAVLNDDPSLAAALGAALDLKAAVTHLGATWPSP